MDWKRRIVATGVIDVANIPRRDMGMFEREKDFLVLKEDSREMLLADYESFLRDKMDSLPDDFLVTVAYPFVDLDLYNAMYFHLGGRSVSRHAFFSEDNFVRIDKMGGTIYARVEVNIPAPKGSLIRLLESMELLEMIGYHPNYLEINISDDFGKMLLGVIGEKRPRVLDALETVSRIRRETLDELEKAEFWKWKGLLYSLPPVRIMKKAYPEVPWKKLKELEGTIRSGLNWIELAVHVARGNQKIAEKMVKERVSAIKEYIGILKEYRGVIEEVVGIIESEIYG